MAAAAAAAHIEQDGPESIGRYLSRQRRLRGISIDELSALTRIPVRSLERLETGRFDGEADGFVRGFVRTVADALGLDPNDTVARTLSEVRIADSARTSVVPLAGRVAMLVAALLVLCLGALGVRAIARSMGAGSAGDAALVYRQDPVRALAEVARAADPDGAALSLDDPALGEPLRPREAERPAEVALP